MEVAQAGAFRRYWMCLNAAYVFEFFLQTLVKKGYLPQPTMLRLNLLLMFVRCLPSLFCGYIARRPASDPTTCTPAKPRWSA